MSGEIATHFGNGTVFADFHHGGVVAGQPAQYLTVDAGVVVFGLDKLAHFNSFIINY